MFTKDIAPNKRAGEPTRRGIALVNHPTSDRNRERQEITMSCCSDVMNPIEASSCCTPQDTTAHAARAIRESGCGCAPVVEDAQSMMLVGVVTERDVCCGVAADDLRASEVHVEEIMRPPSACCDADQSIEDARRQLHDQRTTSLPVADKTGSCCGTVSMHRLEDA